MALRGLVRKQKSSLDGCSLFANGIMNHLK